RSPTNVQPVFETIAQAAAQLCTAEFCHVFRFDGHLIHFAASHGQRQSNIEHMRRIYPIPPSRVSAAARSVLTCQVEEIADIHADPEYQHGDTANYRSIVAVPMLKDSRPVGAICMARTEIGVFPKRQVELLRTFADQAVIAIENARLFESEQTRAKELQESLEYQTALSEVLRVISSYPNDVKPILKAIAQTSGRLCEAEDAHIFLLYDSKYRLAAVNNPDKEWVQVLSGNPLTADMRGSVTARAIREKRVIHIEDTRADPEHAEGLLSRQPRRTVISVPLLRESVVVG